MATSGQLDLSPLGLELMDYNEETVVTTPASYYSTWAAEIGVSSTGTDGTLNALDGTNTGYIISPGASGGDFFDSGITDLAFTSDMGIGCYHIAINNVATTNITTSYSRGVDLITDVAVFNQFFKVWHDFADTSVSLDIIYRSASGTTIIKGQFQEDFNLTLIADFAIRIDNSQLILVVAPVDNTGDSSTGLYLEQYFTGGTVTGREFVNVANSTISELTLNYVLPVVASATAVKVSRQYTCILTGAADSLDDITLPISSFNLDKTLIGVSTLSVACPDGINFSAAILARPNGSLKITSTDIYTDGSEVQDSVTQEYTLSYVGPSQGSSNFSVSLSGQTTLTNPTPGTETMIGESFIFQGAIRVRGEINMNLTPGDTLNYSGGSFTVAKIAINSNSSPVVSVMEVTSG